MTFSTRMGIGNAAREKGKREKQKSCPGRGEKLLERGKTKDL